MLKYFKKRINSDAGFMGITHSLSALSIFLLLVWLMPDLLGKYISNNPSILILSIIVVMGSALMPDFDNTRSTAISSLGILGVGISKAMRAISVIIFQLLHTKYDGETPNAHRGFWHTLASSFLMGFITYLLIGIKTAINIPYLGIITIGHLIVCIILFICFNLTTLSLLGKLRKKIKKNKIVYLFIIILTLIILFYLPRDINYQWLSFSITLGWVIHILGDTFTVSGTPLFWPLGRKGKIWWDWRIPPGIRAGGIIEKCILIPFFIVLTILSIIAILM